jgi:DNA-binding protein
MAEKKPKKESGRKTRRSKSPEVPQKTQVNESVVFVGQKPVKNYVIACITRFSSGSQRVVVKARGRAICRAVDAVELLRRAFLKDLQLEGISIRTEELTREDGRKTNVSTVEITLAKP